MSWVAEKNAMSQNTTNVVEKNVEVGSKNPTAPIDKAMRSCMTIVQPRFEPKMSTNGLQNGLITHGRYSHPVKNVISDFEIPRFTYIRTVRVLTAK